MVEDSRCSDDILNENRVKRLRGLRRSAVSAGNLTLIFDQQTFRRDRGTVKVTYQGFMWHRPAP